LIPQTCWRRRRCRWTTRHWSCHAGSLRSTGRRHGGSRVKGHHRLGQGQDQRSSTGRRRESHRMCRRADWTV